MKIVNNPKEKEFYVKHGILTISGNYVYNHKITYIFIEETITKKRINLFDMFYNNLEFIKIDNKDNIYDLKISVKNNETEWIFYFKN
jgi:hypothetical protein